MNWGFVAACTLFFILALPLTALAVFGWYAMVLLAAPEIVLIVFILKKAKQKEDAFRRNIHRALNAGLQEQMAYRWNTSPDIVLSWGYAWGTPLPDVANEVTAWINERLDD